MISVLLNQLQILQVIHIHVVKKEHYQILSSNNIKNILFAMYTEHLQYFRFIKKETSILRSIINKLLWTYVS